MNILQDLIATLDFEAPVRNICQGVFHTAVQTRYCGLAATLPRDALQQQPPLVREPGSLLEKDPKQLAQLAFSERILEAAIGMATINSLLEIDAEFCLERNAAEFILEKGSGGKVAVIGHFPFIPRIQKSVRKLWVIEKNPKEQDFPEEHADRFIPQADVVAITGTALTNHTLPHLLDLCDPKAYVILLGDTVPLSPVLFDYPIDALSGTRVLDETLALRCVAQGANFRQIQGTRRLTLIRP